MKKPNLPQGDWNVSKHATPEGIHQFGIYAGDSPSDFVIVKGERPIADAIAALPELLAALETVCARSQDIADAMQDSGWHPDTTNKFLDVVRDALTKAGYTEI